jgi:uncharacterized protein (DUF4415 family)
MTANRKLMRTSSSKDDAPDLSTPEWQAKFAAADVMKGTNVVKRGRPFADHRKISATIRLDEDVVNHFRAEGPGWQTRLNAALRKVTGL